MNKVTLQPLVYHQSPSLFRTWYPPSVANAMLLPYMPMSPWSDSSPMIPLLSPRHLLTWATPFSPSGLNCRTGGDLGLGAAFGLTTVALALKIVDASAINSP